MREIKFRAWDKINNKMLIHEPGNTLMIPCGLGVLWLNPSIKDNNYVIKNKHFIMMQFTGLQDKNGIDIYEGDIVRCASNKRCPHEIVWMNEVPSSAILGGGMPGFYLSGLNEGYSFMGEEEIIGNIYQNPELLKV